MNPQIVFSMELIKAKLISNSLHTLDLSQFKNDDLEELADLLDQNSSVVSVEISNSKVFRCEKLMAVLERKQNISTYRLTNISKHADLRQFGDLVVRNGSIVDLKLWYCDLNLEAVQIISSALTANATIQSLEVKFFSIDFDLTGLERLMEAVSCIPSLTKLHFSSDESTISVALITRFVSNNGTLTDLCVCYSRDRVDEGDGESVAAQQQHSEFGSQLQFHGR
jgi:hypothetical protein